MTKLQQLSLKEIFEIRDALVILSKYGLADADLVMDTNIAIARYRDGGDR